MVRVNNITLDNENRVMRLPGVVELYAPIRDTSRDRTLKSFTARAVVDTGANRPVISEDLVKELGCNILPTTVTAKHA